MFIELVKTDFRQNCKHVSKDWIMQHLTVGHAANQLKRVKKSCTIKTPDRPFLGTNQEQISEWGNVLITSLEEKFRVKQHAHLLN